MENATSPAPPSPEVVAHGRRLRKLRTAGRNLAKLPYPPRAYGAVRVSTEEQGSSLEDQPEFITEVCTDATPPWDLRKIFTYTGSASEFRKKDNPVFLSIREVSLEGKADVIVAREASRITRIEVEGLELLDIWRDKGIWIFLYMDGKLYDPSNTADRKSLRNAFNQAADESSTLRDRVSGGLDKHRGKGKLVGRTPYGYVVHYVKKRPVRTIAVSCTTQGCALWYRDIARSDGGEPVTKCPVCGGKVAELQAAIINEIITWAASGKSLAGIALRLNKRGIPAPTRRGRDGKFPPTHGMWITQTVLGIATNPVYIGMICTFPPATADGKHGGVRDRDLGALTPAPDYPVIADPDTFWRAAEYLTLKGVVGGNREGKANSYNTPGSRPGAARHDLTHIALCAVHRVPITPGNKQEVAPKDIPLNAMRDLEAACGAELAAAAVPVKPGQHAPPGSAAGISSVLRAAVADGRLAPGARLPSSRSLAAKLGMSRARVDVMYEALAADGALEVRPQSGVFVPGGSPDGDDGRSYTGRYKRYYRCASAMDVNVPEDEANEYIATVIADHLRQLWEQGGFTRRITAERQQVRSELAQAYESRTVLKQQILKCDPSRDQSYLEALKEKSAVSDKDIARLEHLDAVTSVPVCLQVFMECEGDLGKTRATYLGLDTDQRRTVLKELTAEILMYPAENRGRGHNDIADRVRVTEWSPWYVVSSDQAAAVEGASVAVVEG